MNTLLTSDSGLRVPSACTCDSFALARQHAPVLGATVGIAMALGVLRGRPKGRRETGVVLGGSAGDPITGFATQTGGRVEDEKGHCLLSGSQAG